MSVVLSIYGENVLKEFVLPAIHNAETSLVLDRKTFGLYDNLEISLENVDRKWSFLQGAGYRITKNADGSEACALEDQANYVLETKSGKKLFIIVQMKKTAFQVYEKYDLSSVSAITVGSHPDSIIYYSYSYSGSQYVSKNHCTFLRTPTGFALADTSTNGVFVNDVRSRGTYQLQFGDHIHMWGLDMVFLGTVLAVREDENLKINRTQLPLWQGSDEVVCNVSEESKRIYHRAPRNIQVLETEPVEIEAPPSPREIQDTPLWMTIGPAMTMAIPMLMSSMIAILGARSSGSHASTFMYTG